MPWWTFASLRLRWRWSKCFLIVLTTFDASEVASMLHARRLLNMLRIRSCTSTDAFLGKLALPNASALLWRITMHAAGIAEKISKTSPCVLDVLPCPMVRMFPYRGVANQLRGIRLRRIYTQRGHPVLHFSDGLSIMQCTMWFRPLNVVFSMLSAFCAI